MADTIHEAVDEHGVEFVVLQNFLGFWGGQGLLLIEVNVVIVREGFVQQGEKRIEEVFLMDRFFHTLACALES